MVVLTKNQIIIGFGVIVCCLCDYRNYNSFSIKRSSQGCS